MENFMPKGVYDRQPNAAVFQNEPQTAPETIKMIAMKLDRHYRPMGQYEVVGYLKKEVVKKMPSGEMKVVEPEEFIAGEMAPPPFPGVINDHKVWAQTTIRVPEAEAKTMRQNRIAERAFED
jgi:hypothetical protein